MTQPIPDAALDDRLGWIGMTGSGKTFGCGTCVELVLQKKGRVIVPDPLGVWWGLRLRSDGKTASGYDIVIFGGPHGDIPITPASGALIGETVANMRESAIIDLSQFETAASERRFMLAFLDALYRKTTGEPVHLIFDEADLWAPERIFDKEGEATKLHGMMQTVVRRGRIRGLTSWLISQRPAVLSKNVLSQVDGLVAFRLTAAPDRKALGTWIEGQADKAEAKAILDRLPTKAQGDAVIWLPGRGILADETFPAKVTYDSSRSPKRGENRAAIALKPLDLSKLKERLAVIESEAKSNDPKALRARIAELEKAARTGAAPILRSVGMDAAELKSTRKAGYDEGRQAGYDIGYARGAMDGAALAFKSAEAASQQAIVETIRSASQRLEKEARRALDAAERKHKGSRPPPAPQSPSEPPAVTIPAAAKATPAPAAVPIDGLSIAESKVLSALAELASLGVTTASRDIVAAMAGYKHIRSRPVAEAFTRLTAAGAIAPASGSLQLTEHGRAMVTTPPAPLTAGDMRRRIGAVLGVAAEKALNALAEIYPESISREDLALRCGYAHVRSRPIAEAFSKLSEMGFAVAPAPGHLAASDMLFP